MNSDPTGTRLRRLIAGLCVVTALGVGTSCGSATTDTATQGPGQTGGPGTTEAGSTYEIVPAAVVTAGLNEVRAQAVKIKSTLPTNQTEADTMTTAMYDKWFSFEGTVRKNDKNLYLQMEDGLAAIKAGVQQNNPTKVDKGIKDLEEGMTGYLAKYPG